VRERKRPAHPTPPPSLAVPNRRCRPPLRAPDRPPPNSTHRRPTIRPPWTHIQPPHPRLPSAAPGAGRPSHGPPRADLLTRRRGRVGRQECASRRRLLARGPQDGDGSHRGREGGGLQPPPPAVSPDLLLPTPSTCPSRCCLPNLHLPVSSLSSSSSTIYSFQITFLCFYHFECITT
jgi:hypothetical protein